MSDIPVDTIMGRSGEVAQERQIGQLPDGTLKAGIPSVSRKSALTSNAVERNMMPRSAQRQLDVWSAVT